MPGTGVILFVIVLGVLVFDVASEALLRRSRQEQDRPSDAGAPGTRSVPK